MNMSKKKKKNYLKHSVIKLLKYINHIIDILICKHFKFIVVLINIFISFLFYNLKNDI